MSDEAASEALRKLGIALGQAGNRHEASSEPDSHERLDAEIRSAWESYMAQGGTTVLAGEFLKQLINPMAYIDPIRRPDYWRTSYMARRLFDIVEIAVVSRVFARDPPTAEDCERAVAALLGRINRDRGSDEVRRILAKTRRRAKTGNRMSEDLLLLVRLHTGENVKQLARNLLQENKTRPLAKRVGSRTLSVKALDKRIRRLTKARNP